MLESYWPTNEQIKHCIRTEAEELAEYVLLAVHEPMTLTRRAANDPVGDKRTEKDLLEHLLNSERPIPILGESGIGKSHLIRWLDAKLKVHPKSVHWHIRRIPKNASLGKVLEILLEGLEGEEFDAARKKIKDVGERLKVEEVADHLIVFMSHRLNELWSKTEEEVKQYKKSGQKPEDDVKKRIEKIRRHAKKDALPALLGDTHYKKRLVEKGKCIYQIAHRLIKGSSDDEIATTDYQIKVDDLDFQLNLGDLAVETKNYVVSASLNTMPERVQEAVELLNEVLNEACRKAFQQLFQFHGGSFQELFADIRKQLKQQNKTMVVLVEDMAAISAIEDVLIDSLIQEGMREGIEELCSLRSAIAVTEGYAGYVRRRNTLATRARYEWYIDKYLQDAKETYNRIEDFCGRYLNAARLGRKILEDTYNPSQTDVDWPQIWNSTDNEERELVQSFGMSPSGHPLFPYNSASIRALADKYCSPNRQLEFNPRKILGHILIDVLSNYREKFCNKEFPPIGFEEMECPATLAMELSNTVYQDKERAQTMAAVWGYGAEEVAQLAGTMAPPIARVFAHAQLFDVLDGTIPLPSTSVKKVTTRPVTKPTIPEPESPPGVVTTKIDLLRQIPRDVDDWFKNKSIPQKEANYIRKELAQQIRLSWRNNYSKWEGLRELPALERRSLILINIPYNKNNPPTTLASFGTEKELKNNPLKYKGFIIALLRRIAMNGWDYDDGYTDHCRYLNYINEWVPDAIREMVVKKRDQVGKSLNEHLSSAFVIDPAIGNRTLIEKVSFLCTSQDQLKEGLAETGIEEWDGYRAELLNKWSDMQGEWLWSYAINNHALEGDLLQLVLRGASDKAVPASTARIAQKAQQELITKYPCYELLQGCKDQNDYSETLKSLLGLVEKLSSSSEYKGLETELTARKYINRIKKVLEGNHWTSVKSMLALREGFEVKNTIRALNLLERSKCDDVDLLLNTWMKLFQVNEPRMKVENSEQGSDKRQEIKQLIIDLLSETQEVLEGLQEISV